MRTTFWMDFTIADKIGEASVKDTYQRMFEKCKDNPKFMTELTIILNHKMWQHFQEGEKNITQVYVDLWKECDDWCCENLQGEELEYFFKATD